MIELNRAVAVAMSEGVEKGLRVVEELTAGATLEGYLYLHSTRADLLRRLGRGEEAARSYRRALELCQNTLERKYLRRRLAEVAPASDGLNPSTGG